MDSIRTETLSRIAREVFGETTVVSCLRKIGPSTSHGITETPPSTRNLLYVVDLDGHPHSYVFRFSRVEDDVYEREAQNYRLLAEATGIRVPTIYSLDTSKQVVPTAYMVMDYLPGKLWQYMAHPENPRTDQRDKAAIGRAVGRFYARAHESVREMPHFGVEAQTLAYSMDRLEEAARIGSVQATPEEVDGCRLAISNEPLFQTRNLHLCLADTEIHVLQKDDRWELAFACDAEWVEFRHRYADLAQRLFGARPWWSVDVPATDLDPDEVMSHPFFQGYQEVYPLDGRELLHHSIYYQLGLWAYVGMTSRTPDKKAWVRQEKGALISELVRIVARRARDLAAVHGA